MKHLLMTLSILVVGSSLMLNDADAARRFGGGSSSGMQRSQPMKRDAAPSQNTAPAQPGAPQRSGASRWLGPIAGIAAGIGLAALFSHLGLGEELASIALIVLIAVAVFMLFRFLLRRFQPQPRVQYAGGPGGTVAYDATTMGRSAATASAPNRNALHTPADFNADHFVRNAKRNFLRLQAANDAGNIEDIRAFTTPEMFAEIKLQMQERGNTSQKTDVVTLDAELVDFTTEFRQHIASVRFHGTIRETAGAAPEAFDETWHFTKRMDSDGEWVIAGIQQSA